MAAALSEDLRRRIFSTYEEEDATPAELAKRFKVSDSSVRRIIALGTHCGTLAPLKTGPKGAHKFKEKHRDAMRAWLEETPDLFLRELREKFIEEYDLTISTSHLSNVLAQMGLSRKKNH